MLSYMFIVNHSIAPHFNCTHFIVRECSSSRLIRCTYFIYTQSIVVVTRQHKQLATSRHPSPSLPQQAPWLPLFPAHCCEPRYHQAGCPDYCPPSSSPRACPAESQQLLFHLFRLWTRPVLFNQLAQCIELLNSIAVPSTILAMSQRFFSVLSWPF
jgi:hypothetical protein